MKRSILYLFFSFYPVSKKYIFTGFNVASSQSNQKNKHTANVKVHAPVCETKCFIQYFYNIFKFKLPQ